MIDAPYNKLVGKLVILSEVSMVRRIANSVLAVLVLFGTTMVSISSHYCGGELVNTVAMQTAETCGPTACHQNTQNGEQLPFEDHISAKDCCQLELVALQGISQLKDFPEDLFVADAFITAPYFELLPLVVNPSLGITHHLDSDPWPPADVPAYILTGAFLS